MGCGRFEALAFLERVAEAQLKDGQTRTDPIGSGSDGARNLTSVNRDSSDIGSSSSSTSAFL